MAELPFSIGALEDGRFGFTGAIDEVRYRRGAALPDPNASPMFRP